ncbi:hypothetical protein BVRB_027320, partial [Beta vulgaris subsp. vulgaris]
NYQDMTSIDSPMFTLERIQWQSSNSTDDGDIVDAATGNNALHIATTNRNIINYDLGSNAQNSIVISRRPEVVVQHIWCSPTSPLHILVSAQGYVSVLCYFVY